MNKLLAIAGALLILFVIGYGAHTLSQRERTPASVADARETDTFSSAELGLSFTYPIGPEGYVLQEAPINDPANNLVQAFMLTRTEDAIRQPPQGGEGPPVIAIYVFANPQKQRPQAWADNHIQYSNIDLSMGEVREAVIGGANAIRYRADGLYASEVTVVAHGGHMYLITGQFISEDSDIRRDYEPILQSVRFVPAPDQQ